MPKHFYLVQLCFIAITLVLMIMLFMFNTYPELGIPL